MNGNHREINNRGNHEINQQARLAECFYLRRTQEMTQHSLKKPSFLEGTRLGAIFNVIFGGLLANKSRLSGKEQNMRPDDWEKAHAG